jgi:hypothetical protein
MRDDIRRFLVNLTICDIAKAYRLRTPNYNRFNRPPASKIYQYALYYGGDMPSRPVDTLDFKGRNRLNRSLVRGVLKKSAFAISNSRPVVAGPAAAV